MTRVIPQLTVADISKSIDFYMTRLGFTVTLLDPPVNPEFAVVELDDASLYFVTGGSREEAYQLADISKNKWGIGVRIYLEVDDAELLHAKLIGLGVTPNRPLSHNEAEDYTEFSILDPDGYEIGIYS